MESHQAESTAAAYITRGLLRHLVDLGVLSREDAQEVLSRAAEDCLAWGPTSPRYQSAADLIDRIRDEDFPETTSKFPSGLPA